MNELLGSAYTPGQMTYDLRRLRLNGMIHRLPHTNHYVLTADGIRIAVFYAKVYNRLLVPLTAANQAPGTTRTPHRADGNHPPRGRLRQPGAPCTRRVKLATNVDKLTTKDR